MQTSTSTVSLRSSGNLTRFCILAFGLWLHAACSMLAATTLPTAIDEIGGARLIGWAFSLYQLGSIVAGAATGLLVSRHGVRTSLLLAGGIYVCGSVVCALAPTMAVLVTGRLIQGVGGGGLVALTFVFINREFPADLIPRLQGILSALWSVSAFCGPLVGGSFATLGLWRYAFWAFVLQGLVFLVAVVLIFRDSPGRGKDSSVRIPIFRLGILATAILCVSLAGATDQRALSLLLICASVALFFAFLRLDDRRAKSRMFPSRPFFLGHRIGAGLVTVFTAGVSTMTFLVFAPYFLEVLFGLTPLAAGYVVVLESVGWGCAAVAVSRSRHDILFIRCGVALVTLSVGGLAVTMSSGLLFGVVAFALVQGAAFGMMWGFIIKRAVGAVDEAERDITSSALPATQQSSFAVGAALAGLVANASGFGDNVDPAVISGVAFWAFAAFLPVALFANYAAWRFTRDN